MKACNGRKKVVESTPTREEDIEIKRLEPVIIEVEQEGNVFSHLILFEVTCRINLGQEEITVDGDIKESIYEIQQKNEDEF
jgi:hypothetical protein